MRKSILLGLILITSAPVFAASNNERSIAPNSAIAWAQTVESQPQQPPRRRRERVRYGRKRSGIKGAFRKSGARYGRGFKNFGKGVGGFGKNIALGRPIRAGRKLGKGAGSLGKNAGIGTGYAAVGTARTGAKVGRVTGRAVKRAVKP